MSATKSPASPRTSDAANRDRPASPVEDLCRALLERAGEDVSGLVVVYQMPELNAIYLNAAARRRLGARREDLGKLNLGENVGLSSQTRFQMEILPQTRVLGRWTGECELHDRWGREFPVQAVFRTLAEKHEEFLALFAHERVASPEANGARLTDGQLLQALLDNAPDQIYFKDASSRFLRISRAQAEKFGLGDPSLAIGKTDFDFFSAEHAATAHAEEQRILRGGEPVIDHEEMETWENGGVTWVATTKLPLYDSGGQLVGTFGVSRDITHRKQAEATKREMEAQLQLATKMESIGRLAAGVAHEINTPNQFITDNTHFLTNAFSQVATLIGRYRALRDEAAKLPDCSASVAATVAAEQAAEIDYLLGEIPRCLQQTLDGLARVARIVRSLKEFAHPNSPELTLADLNRVIETSLVISRHEWKYVAEVATELDANLPQVPCVVDEFNQVMLNIVINAAHAIADALKARGGERGKITIRTRHSPPWAVLEIEDTGTGMPPEVASRIFEPFFTTKPLGKGTGQGLAIVRTVVVTHHRGTIDVTTQPGRGTKFTIKLPLEMPPAKAPAAAPA